MLTRFAVLLNCPCPANNNRAQPKENIMNIILTAGNSENAIDEKHTFVSIGQNCWGIDKTPKESMKNAKANAPRGANLFITRVAPPLQGLGIDPIDGAVQWSEHDAKNCPLCTVGKGIRINTDKTYPEKIEHKPAKTA